MNITVLWIWRIERPNKLYYSYTLIIIEHCTSTSFFYCPSLLLINGFSIWTERKILGLIAHWNRSRAFVFFYQSSTIYSYFIPIRDESAKMFVWKSSKPSLTVLWTNKSFCFCVTLLLLVMIIQTVLLYIESMFLVECYATFNDFLCYYSWCRA